MAQTGYTPIQLYYSSTTTNVPLAASLANGELAINITDGKLFYKDNSAAVQVIGWKTVPATAGGTGQTSYAIGDLLYADTTTTLAKLADVATGNALISGGIGVAPSWGKIGLTTHVSGVLPVANGGTNASSASITAFNNITGYSASGATGTTTTNLVFSDAPTFTGNTNFATLQTSGKLSIGTAPSGGVFNYIVGSNSTNIISYWGNVFSTLLYTGIGNITYAAGENSGDAVLFVRKSPTTSRSINAAGTINASGADYAEYMEKSGNFTIAKGDICGVNVNGKLTNVFADAVSFVVKSTNPSYVGGDVWGSEEALGLTKPKQPEDDATDEEKNQYATNKSAFDAALEATRQKFDRIAFCGQVPINVLGASPGQYIIPVNDNGAIKGEAVGNPTFEQYQQAVGKVIAIESDGRAKIIVKVS